VAPVPSQSSTYDANDRLDSDSYDDNGNTTAANGNNYAYDFENHLTSLNGATVSYVYDGDGNRVAKTVAGVTTNYLVDTNNPTGYAQVVEELQAGAVVKNYTYGHDLISQRCAMPAANCSVSYYQYDGHGSVRLLTGVSGEITDTYDYDAFGNLISRTGTTSNNYLFSGEQLDSSLGFYYLRARYLNPSPGRFWSMDSYEGGSYDPGSLHKYSYTRNSPTNLIDPSGHFSLGDTLNTSVLIGTISGFTLGLVTGGIEGAVNGAVQGSVMGALVPLTGAGVGTFLLGNAARGVFITGWGVGLGNAATSGFSFATASTEEERRSAGINLLISAGFMYFGPKILQRVNTRIISAEQANIDCATRGYSEAPWSAGLSVTETTLFAAAKYVRVYTGNRLRGAYVMEASEILGLTADQIKQKFALPFLPDKIAIAEIPAGTTIRIGVAGPNNFAPSGGGGMQVEIQNPNHPNPPTPPTGFTP
jgi:RHS repeat-associated protein